VLGKLIKFHNHECQNLYNYCGRATTDRNTIFLSDSQAAFNALNNFQINPTLVWDCHHSPVKLTEHHRLQILCILGCMGIDGIEIADHWLEQAPQPHTGPEPPAGMCLKVVRGVIRDWINRKHEEQWQSIYGQRQAEGFLKKLSAKKVGKLLNMNINQPRVMTGLLAGYCHFT
jgi:hypothetical protein